MGYEALTTTTVFFPFLPNFPVIRAGAVQHPPNPNSPNISSSGQEAPHNGADSEAEGEGGEGGVEEPVSPLHLAPTSPGGNGEGPEATPRAMGRHPGHVKSASISAGSSAVGSGTREAPASAGADARGDSTRWRRVLGVVQGGLSSGSNSCSKCLLF